jgi:hypothetical protein
VSEDERDHHTWPGKDQDLQGSRGAGMQQGFRVDKLEKGVERTSRDTPEWHTPGQASLRICRPAEQGQGVQHRGRVCSRHAGGQHSGVCAAPWLSHAVFLQWLAVVAPLLRHDTNLLVVVLPLVVAPVGLSKLAPFKPHNPEP